jgi:hypothetical protein
LYSSLSGSYPTCTAYNGVMQFLSGSGNYDDNFKKKRFYSFDFINTSAGMTILAVVIFSTQWVERAIKKNLLDVHAHTCLRRLDYPIKALPQRKE